MDEITDKLNIWWKLAIISLVLNVIATPFWMLLSAKNIISLIFPNLHPHQIWLLYVFFALSSGYFSVFVIWHWRTRYAGRNHLVWPILAVIAFWPNFFSLMSGTIFISIAYFFIHVVPDIKKKGAYASPPIIRISHPATPIPPRYQLVKSACFVLGWALIVLGLTFAALSCISHFVCWNAIEEKLPGLIGEHLTKTKCSALILASYVGKITVVTNVVCSIGIAIGTVLLYISPKMRWRLLDEQEKVKLKSIQTHESI